MAADVILPYRTDWREMSSILDYCKGKGADRGALEARFGSGESLRETLNALEQLGLIDRGDAGDIRLTQRGEQLAYAPDPARMRSRLIEAMLAYPPYRYPLERALAEDMDLLDGPWVEHIWQVDMRLGQPRNRVEEARTFFFRLADEAGLGTYRRGVRGQTTRLELVPDFGAALRPILERSRDAERNEPGERQPEPVQVARPEPAAAGHRREDATSDTAPVAPAPAVVSIPNAPQGMSIHVDMTEWELDKIAAFLRLIGYVSSRD